MKLKIYISLFLLLIISASNAQVGIGTTAPNAASMLDITSTNSGLLIPRIPLVSASDVTTIVSLNAGDYIEIYAENYQSGVNIDSYIGKTYFEVKQIK